MDGSMEPLGPADIAAALDWWRDAGVDLDFVDDPVRWLAEPEADAAEQVPALPSAFVAPRREETAAPGADDAVTRIGGGRAGWPTDLAAFAAWWLAEPSLDGGVVRGRVPPRGVQGAELMVVVAAPGEEDGEELLSGREGALLGAMLRAMGIAPEAVYFASALPRHTPLPDWDRLAAQGLGAVLAHHVRLVAPRRLIAFGTNILPLLGHDPAQIAATSLRFNHEGVMTPLLGALDLATLAGGPARKAGLWRRWLEFSSGSSGS
jgi:DNA polymerase